MPSKMNTSTPAWASASGKPRSTTACTHVQYRCVATTPRSAPSASYTGAAKSTKRSGSSASAEPRMRASRTASCTSPMKVRLLPPMNHGRAYTFAPSSRSLAATITVPLLSVRPSQAYGEKLSEISLKRCCVLADVQSP